MKAAFFQEHGGIEKLKVEEIERPKISPNEALIKTQFAALNHLDIFVLKGWPALKLKLPHVLGSDGGGFIEEVGSEVTQFQKGDPVTVNPGISCGKCYYCLAGKQNFCKQFSILGENQWGTFAEFFKVPEANIMKIPRNFSMEKAAAAPLTFLTAWRLLKTQAKLQAGEIIFIHGAGGGVSTAAIQIAKYLGAKVITSTSTEKKEEHAKSVGADNVVNYKENPEYGKTIYKELTNEKGVDVVLDSVGKETFQDSLRILKPGGRLVTPGATTGAKTEIDIRRIFWKQLKITGSTMSNQKEFRDVMKLVFSHELEPIVDKIFSIEQVHDAEKYLKKGKQFGKVLLKI